MERFNKFENNYTDYKIRNEKLYTENERLMEQVNDKIFTQKAHINKCVKELENLKLKLRHKFSFKNTAFISDEKELSFTMYNDIDEWDSIGHMTLIAALEENFKISFETDDIVDFSSYKKGMEILEKYKVSFK